jgi:hypothetical protein
MLFWFYFGHGDWAAMNEGEKVAFYENERAMNELKLIIFSNLKI